MLLGQRYIYLGCAGPGGKGGSELEDRLRMAGIRIKTVLRVGSLMRRALGFIAAETGNILAVLCLGRRIGIV